MFYCEAFLRIFPMVFRTTFSGSLARFLAMIHCPMLFLSAAAVMAAAITGCSSYSSVSSYEQAQGQKKSFVNTVTSAGGKVELKHYSVAGVSGDAWNLSMANAKVPDDVITLMAGTSYLAEADFSKSSITDAQLLKMDELQLLQVTMNLDLSDTAITDEAFTKIKGMRAVSKIKLKGSKVTPAGVAAFKKAYLANPETIVVFKKPTIEL